MKNNTQPKPKKHTDKWRDFGRLLTQRMREKYGEEPPSWFGKKKKAKK